MRPLCVLNPHSAARPILLIEDNDMDLDFCLQALEEHAVGNPVLVCRDGDEAIDFINAHPGACDPLLPLLVLLDLRLPKVDGMDVLRHARQCTHWRDVPMVALTTSHQDQDRATALAQGISAFVTKPVDFDAFSRIIAQIKWDWLLDHPLCEDRQSNPLP